MQYYPFKKKYQIPETFCSYNIMRIKSTMFPHPNIHKYSWMSPDGKAHNQINHILVDSLL
jgi:hypothetical protein